jgi:uncharacterized membrane protein
MRWVIALLAVLAVWMAVMLYVLRPWPDRFFFGGFFLAIGIANVLFYKTTGRKFFANTQASPAFVSRVWANAGEKSVQVLCRNRRHLRRSRMCRNNHGISMKDLT